MNKKIILKETQYNRIVTLLAENVNIKNVLNNVKVGSILNIVDENNGDYKISVVNVDNGIVKGKDSGDIEVLIDLNSYDEATNQISIKRLNQTTNQLVDSTIKIKDIKILNSSGSNDEIESDSQTKDDELFNKYYKEIVDNPELRKAFYTAPSLWNYFTAAMRNKKARGSGIYPAYKLINNYFNSRINEKLPGFTDKENKRATFYLPEDIEIGYYTLTDSKNRRIFRLDKGYRKATVRQYEAGFGDVKVLSYRSSGGNYGYKIAVKKPTGDKPDEYFCDLYVNINNVRENKYKVENLRLKFMNSDGYQSQEKTK